MKHTITRGVDILVVGAPATVAAMGVLPAKQRAFEVLLRDTRSGREGGEVWSEEEWAQVWRVFQDTDGKPAPGQ